MGLKDILFFRRFKRAVKYKTESVGINPGNSIGIFHNYTDSSDINYIETLARFFEQKGKSTTIIQILTSDISESTELQIGKKDLNWFGYPTSQKFQSIIDRSFDISITLFHTETNILLLTNTLAKSNFKIGTNTTHVKHFQLVIDSSDNDLKTICKDIKISLSKLSKI